MSVEVTTCKPPKSPRTRKALMDLASALTTEKHIEQTCSVWLELDGWRTLKTDPVSRKEWGKGFGELGMADRLYIRYDPARRIFPATSCERIPVALIWIEWKSRRGTPSVKQLDWHAAERARGALTLIAGRDFERTIEGFMAFYRESGLMRRKI
jgi:hypothetical protein